MGNTRLSAAQAQEPVVLVTDFKRYAFRGEAVRLVASPTAAVPPSRVFLAADRQASIFPRFHAPLYHTGFIAHAGQRMRS